MRFARVAAVPEGPFGPVRKKLAARAAQHPSRSSVPPQYRLGIESVSTQYRLLLAGEEGFEPSYGGIKIRCLNQLGDSPSANPRIRTEGHPRPSPTRALQIAARYSFSKRTVSGCRSNPRTTKPRISAGILEWTERASRSAANSANTQAPEPLMRASANCLSHSRCAATSAWRRRTTGSRSFLPKPAEKPDILMVFEFRVNSGDAKIAGVDTITGGISSTYHALGNSSGVRRSPMPSPNAFPPKRKNGTSAPRPSANSASLSPGRSRPQRRFSTASVVAQSELPPPKPPPIGIFFSSSISTPVRASP